MGAKSAIILAGGQSSRMGFDKQLIRVNGKLIVEYIYDKLKNHFEEIIVVTKTPELYEHLDVILTKDVYPRLGPLAGIHAGLIASENKASYVIACDMPIVNEEYIEYLKARFKENLDIDGMIATYDGYIEPMNAIYSRNLIEDLEMRLKSGDLRIRDLVNERKFIMVEENILRNYSKDLEMFRNINYQEDLEKFNLEGNNQYERNNKSLA